MLGDNLANPIDTLTLHRYQCRNESYTLDLGDGVELTLMLVPAGEFMMGDSANNSENFSQYWVKPSSFLMGATLVTQAQWRVVAGYNVVDLELVAEPSHFTGDDLPVENVSWYDAAEFCQRLSQKTGKNFHLPSESQWEYACRAETKTDYHFGPEITSELANYGNAVGQTTVVKSYPPNRYGLYDMHGNVWEWCQDHWHDNSDGAPSNGSDWLTDDEQSPRIVRGGSWDVYPRNCRSAYRYLSLPEDRFNSFGFRVSCSAPRSLT